MTCASFSILTFEKTKKPLKAAFLLSRGGQIRTDDLHIPNVARYRATLHPELFALPLCSEATPV